MDTSLRRKVMNIKSLLVLAISSVAFMASCSCSNDPDQKFLNEINGTLANANIATCDDAVNVLKASNIDIFNYEFKKDENREFVYDFDAKQFVIMKDDSIVCTPSGYKKNDNNFSYFKFVETYNGNSTFSQYLLDNYTEPETLYVTTGIDVGSHKDIKNVTYAGSVGIERNIKIRVYCDYLTIHADSDEVSFYGNANNVFVNEVTDFNVYGQTSYVQLKGGTTNFKKGSSTDFLEVPSNYEDEIQATQEEGATIICKINVPEDIDISAYKLEPVEASSSLDVSKSGMLRLTNDITLSSDLEINLDDALKTVIIDLNGYTITTDNNSMVEVCSGNSCYLIDTESSFNDNCRINLSGTSNISINGYLLMNGGSIVTTNSLSPALIVQNGGAFDMYGGQIIYDSANYNAIQLINNSVTNICYATATSNSGIFETSGTATLNVIAGKFDSKVTEPEEVNDTIASPCFNISGGTVNILGGSFYTNDGSCINVANTAPVNLNITGGSFYDEKEYVYLADASSTVVVNIDDATVENTVTVNADSAYLYSHYGYMFNVTGNKVNEVTLNCNSGTYDYYLDNGITIAEALKDHVKVKQEGNWVTHYA